MPILYSVRLILMVFTPQAHQMPTWKMVLWQAIRDALVVLNLFFWQRYSANYTDRRASLALRHQDAWELSLLGTLYLSLELPVLLDWSWALSICIAVSLGMTLYLWEIQIIRRLSSCPSPSTKFDKRDAPPPKITPA
jgi:hypothetical protein